MRFFTPLVVASLFAAQASAQQVIPPLKKEFLDSTFTVIPTSTGAVYRRETEHTDSVGGIIRDYFLDGRLQSICTYDHLRKGIVNGTFENWYDNGQLKWHQEYVHGKLTGERRLYYSSGQLKRREKYANDKRTSGECFNEQGAPVAFFEYQIMPVYPEGDGSSHAIVSAVARGVVYPKDALHAGLTGQVLVTFVISKAGDVTTARVVQSVYPSIDAAALLAVQKLKRFKPGQQDGKPIAVSYTVPITFKIGEPRRSIFDKRTTYQLPGK